MDKLTGLTAFVRTAETQSFVAAGRLLGISASAVGKSVARLEERLGVRLFQRSTRRVRLTAEGAQFFERCRHILHDIDEAEALLSHASEVPRGRLRISVITIGYRFLMPVLGEFMQRYPDIELDLDFDDRIVDVIDNELDAVIRSGELPDSRLMARRIGSYRIMLYASPAYLQRHGTPQHPRELERHSCLQFRYPSKGKLQKWVMRNDPGENEPNLPVSLVCNNIEAMLMACTNGLGIGYMPTFLTREAVAEGSLLPVLESYMLQQGPFWVLWPSNRQISPKLRVFVDFICEHLFREEKCEIAPVPI
ncbi:LysR family transcriptional regulator [Dyella caseinilytica]|uniref:LysR family transcriptional regulator n=1 Tax=Dyella caseinilytica TaxID=1849581 RepID=A0ABX7GUJ6_9GAMM|nr:LysR family transcriptional regulator [Dyella caseinilytica]QRN54128.1 LysR family transcriptional regulator [Dyella caseinilytica]GFZ91727.1 LysR family transcriptional regulator [Dyella caseinilytica]